jgi:hypothetical protein
MMSEYANGRTIVQAGKSKLYAALDGAEQSERKNVKEGNLCRRRTECDGSPTSTLL